MDTLRSGSIVVGVDESALAGQAVRWAAEQAALEGRTVRLVHASPPVTAGWTQPAMAIPLGTFTSQHAYGEALIARARSTVQRSAPGVRVEEMCEVADPRTLLLDVAEDAHMVVLGSRGRGPALSHLVGSVGLSVVRHAACPIVVHRPGHPGRVHDGVFVAVDATEDSVAVLQFAFRQASLRRLPIRILQFALDPRPALAGAPMVGDVYGLVERDALALAGAMAGVSERYPDVHTSVRTTTGLPEQEAARTASRADLLVLGTRQRGVLGRLVAGSVSTAILEHATCPVAVVPIPARMP